MGFLQSRDSATPRAARGGASSSKFALVDPGFYLARVEGAESKTFTSRAGIDYLKIVPEIVLVNDAETTINRQDIVVGAIDDDGVLYRPDGDETKPALFSEMGFFLSALGFITVDPDGEERVDVDHFSTELLLGQYVRVKVVHDTYTTRNGEEKSKNKIDGFFAVREEDIEEHGLYEADNGMVFDSSKAADTYFDVLDALASGSDIPF